MGLYSKNDPLPFSLLLLHRLIIGFLTYGSIMMIVVCRLKGAVVSSTTMHAPRSSQGFTKLTE